MKKYIDVWTSTKGVDEVKWHRTEALCKYTQPIMYKYPIFNCTLREGTKKKNWYLERYEIIIRYWEEDFSMIIPKIDGQKEMFEMTNQNRINLIWIFYAIIVLPELIIDRSTTHHQLLLLWLVLFFAIGHWYMCREVRKRCFKNNTSCSLT